LKKKVSTNIITGVEMANVLRYIEKGHTLE
jgi:hypothetical protein